VTAEEIEEVWAVRTASQLLRNPQALRRWRVERQEQSRQRLRESLERGPDDADEVDDGR
jgi:hypothetical protein